MARLLIFAAIALLLWKLVTGRWPWESKRSTRHRALSAARKLLAVPPHASRADILAAHRRKITMVHPDRGGSNAQVHEADAARDLLLADLPAEPKEPA